MNHIFFDETPDNTPGQYPPIAGFWKRFGAWFIDSILIMLAGQAFCLVFKPMLLQIGPYGRLIGLLFILPYFGIMNSRVCAGQTFGKRLMRIAVRSADNQPVSLLRSLGRISILAFPFLLGGWPLPQLENPAAAFLSGLIVFGLGGAVIYTMVINRAAGQGTHDLLCGTYVVQPDGLPVETFPKTAIIHRIIAGGWVGLTAVLLLFLSVDGPSYVPKPSAESLDRLERALAADPRFFTAQTRDQTITPEKNPAYRSAVVEVWTVGELPDSQRWETAVDIAGIVLRDAEGIDEFDQIQVKLTYGYDIGIASYSSGFWYSNPVEEWRTIVAETQPISE